MSEPAASPLGFFLVSIVTYPLRADSDLATPTSKMLVTSTPDLQALPRQICSTTWPCFTLGGRRMNANVGSLLRREKVSRDLSVPRSLPITSVPVYWPDAFGVFTTCGGFCCFADRFACSFIVEDGAATPAATTENTAATTPATATPGPNRIILPPVSFNGHSAQFPARTH